MKKFLFLALVCAPFFVQAQTKAEKKIIKKTATVLCDCMNEGLNKLDKDVRKTFITAIDHPDGMENYLMNLDTDMQQKMAAQLDKLSNMGENMTRCLDESNLKSEVEKTSMSGDDLMKASLSEMGKMKKCKDAYTLFKIVDKASDSE